MKRLIYYSIVVGVVVIGYLLADSLAAILAANAVPVAQDTLHQQKIYAYRDWQSVGVQVHPGETVEIQAEGEWLYTPGDYHGPKGHPRYAAPNFYPIANVPSGILIGRIGETGEPFPVGSHTWYATRGNQEQGPLYLRINDDILSDNKGAVVVDVTVTQVAEAYR
ncbi:MAG: hypothetical protein R3E79_00830 [Caldilineaceae bacterium]